MLFLDDWYSRRESNPQLPLRRGLLYPFNYGSLFIWDLFYSCVGAAVNAAPYRNLLTKVFDALLDFLAVAQEDDAIFRLKGNVWLRVNHNGILPLDNDDGYFVFGPKI